MKQKKLTSKYARGYSSAAIGWLRKTIRDFEVALPDLTAREVHLRSNFTEALPPHLQPWKVKQRLGRNCMRRGKSVWDFACWLTHF